MRVLIGAFFLTVSTDVSLLIHDVGESSAQGSESSPAHRAAPRDKRRASGNCGLLCGYGPCGARLS